MFVAVARFASTMTKCWPLSSSEIYSSVECFLCADKNGHLLFTLTLPLLREDNFFESKIKLKLL